MYKYRSTPDSVVVAMLRLSARSESNRVAIGAQQTVAPNGLKAVRKKTLRCCPRRCGRARGVATEGACTSSLYKSCPTLDVHFDAPPHCAQTPGSRARRNVPPAPSRVYADSTALLAAAPPGGENLTRRQPSMASTPVWGRGAPHACMRCCVVLVQTARQAPSWGNNQTQEQKSSLHALPHMLSNICSAC